MKLKRSETDPCIYYRKSHRKILIIEVYVDDIFILYNDKMLASTKKNLAVKFKIKDLGKASHLLRMKITRDKQQGLLWIDQETYIRETLEKFNMTECKPVSTPADPNQKLTTNQSKVNQEDPEEAAKVLYKEAVGSLLYIS